MWGSEAPASRPSFTITCTYAASSCSRMRSRHTDMAVSTSSGSRSASDHTGFGEFTISSWAPLRGPGGEQLGLAAPGGQRVAPASGSPGASAG